MSNQIRIEECLAPVRWDKRWHPLPSCWDRMVETHVLQQEWRITLGSHHAITGVFIPADVRTEWRDVPVAEAG